MVLQPAEVRVTWTEKIPSQGCDPQRFWAGDEMAALENEVRGYPQHHLTHETRRPWWPGVSLVAEEAMGMKHVTSSRLFLA